MKTGGETPNDGPRNRAAPTDATSRHGPYIAVQGETNLTTNFIQELEADAEPFGLIIRVVDRHNTDLNYSVVLAEESTLGSAAAAIVALDRDGHVVASVVRSDGFSGRAAVSVATKEFAKKLAALKK